MLQLTIYTNNEAFKELGKVNIGHFTSFDQSIVTYHFSDRIEQIGFIKILIEAYARFTTEGDKVMINMKDYQRFRFRIDTPPK